MTLEHYQRPYETLALESEPDWLTIWLNKPDTRNALSAEMVADLGHVFDLVANDTAIRGVTLRGRGGIFCAGGDLKAFNALASGAAVDAGAIARDSVEGGLLFYRVDTLPAFVLVLVEGAAMAGGLGLACCADVVAVTRDAKFALTETTLGIPPAQIAPFVVNRIGEARARRLMLTAARFTGDEALAMGIADYAVVDAVMLAQVEAELKSQVRRCAPDANRATKAILRESRLRTAAALRDFAAEQFTKCLLGREGKEGIRAFVEKRAPDWAKPRTSNDK